MTGTPILQDASSAALWLGESSLPIRAAGLWHAELETGHLVLHAGRGREPKQSTLKFKLLWACLWQ